MSSHTPGPWKWAGGWKHIRGTRHGVEGNGPKYGDIRLYGPEGDILPLRVDHYEIIWNDVERDTLTEADARLIAASPDLKEEVQRFHKLLYDLLDGLRPDEEDIADAIPRVENVLAKTEGVEV